MTSTLLYIAAIVGVNIGFMLFPPIMIAGAAFPPMSLVVGFVFVIRDYAQKEIGHRIWLAMIVAGVISYFMAAPAIALASATAFMISESADWAVYSFSERTFKERVLLSSLISTPIDSAVFLLMIDAFSWTALLLMFLSKMVGALVVVLTRD